MAYTCLPAFEAFFISSKCGIVGLPNVGKSTLFNALNLQALIAMPGQKVQLTEVSTGKDHLRMASVFVLYVDCEAMKVEVRQWWFPAAVGIARS